MKSNLNHNATSKVSLKILILLLSLFVVSFRSHAQVLQMSDFAVFGGAPDCVDAPGPSGSGQTPPTGSSLGSGCRVHVGVGSVINGNIGSYHFVETNGNVDVNGNIHSGGRVNLANGDLAHRVTAADGDVEVGDIFSTGSGATIIGNIDVNGDITVNTHGGSTVLGIVTHPTGTSYVGPVPGGGEVIGVPPLPTLPVMPAITPLTCPTGSSDNITTSRVLTPGSYGDLGGFGNASGITITFFEPGDYFFNSINMDQGPTKTFIYDFNGKPGKINIYVCGDVNTGVLNAQFANPSTAACDRIYFETHGNGLSSEDNFSSIVIAPGSNFFGTVWAPYAAIHVGAGQGATFVTGHLWSATQVNIQHDVTVTTCCTSSITICKEVCPTTETSTWNFTLKYPAGSGHADVPFTLVGGNCQTFSGLDNGDYAVVETPVTGWKTTNTCMKEDGSVALVTVNCSDATCTFTNKKINTIKICKNVCPTTDGSTWNFTLHYPAGSGIADAPFTLTGDGDCKTFTDVPSGDYTVTETAVTGWKATNTCMNGTDGNVASLSVNCSDANCTFTNKKINSLTIVKQIVFDPATPFCPIKQDWDFTIQKVGDPTITPFTIHLNELPSNIIGGPATPRPISCGGKSSIQLACSYFTQGRFTFTDLDPTATYIVTEVLNHLSDNTFVQTISPTTSNVWSICRIPNPITDLVHLNAFSVTVPECGSVSDTIVNTGGPGTKTNCPWCSKSAVRSQVYENFGDTCAIPDILVDVRLPHGIDPGTGRNNDIVTIGEIGTNEPATWSIQAAVDYVENTPGFTPITSGQIFIAVTASDIQNITGLLCGQSCARPPSGDSPWGTENVVIKNTRPERLNVFGCSVTMHAYDVSKPVITIANGTGGKVTVLDLHVWNSTVAGYLINNNSSLVVVKNAAAYYNKLGYDAQSGEIQLTGSQHVIGNTSVGILVEGNNVKLRTMHDITNNPVGIKVTGSGNAQVTDGNVCGSNGTGILVTGNNNVLHGDDADNNTGNGIEVTGCGNTLDEEEAQGNGGNGIKVTAAANCNKLNGNDADKNGGNGILACNQVDQGGNSGSGNTLSPQVNFLCIVVGPPTFLVTDQSADKAFKYDASFHLVSSSSLHANDKDAYDATDDGTKTYTVDKNFKVYNYPGATKVESPKVLKDNTGGSTFKTPTGLAISGNDLWVVDGGGSKKIFKYSLSAVFTAPAGNINATGSIAFTGTNANAAGLFIVGTNLYVLDESDKQLYRYSTAGGAGTASKVMKDNVGGNLNSPTGAVSDGSTVWVTTKDKVYTYDLATLFSGVGNLNSGTPYSLDAASNNKDATGITIGSSANFPTRDDEEVSSEIVNLNDNALQVYPNPTSGQTRFVFKSESASSYVITVFDMVGRAVITEQANATEGVNSHDIDMSTLAKGMYMVMLQNGNEVRNVKVMVQ